jgi:hypothetical protein
MTFRIEGQVDGNGGKVGGLDVEIWEDGGSWDTPRAIVQTSSNGWFVAQVDPALFSGGGPGAPALAYFKVIQDGVELVNTFHDVEWDSSSPAAVQISVVPRPENEECCPDYIIRGVVETAPGAGTPVGFPAWTVELWEDGGGWDLPRATVQTESDGTFRVELGGNAFATAARTIRFRVANHGSYVTPDPTPTWNPTLLDTVVHLAISVTAVRTHVEGFLRYRDGSPVASYTVKGFASQMRTEDLVGSGSTSADGHFAFDCAYTGTKFDLILRAYDGSATPVEVAHSALVPDVPNQVIVDLVVGNVDLAGKAEYTRMIEAIDAARSAVGYASLTDADVAQIAAKYLLPKDRLQLAVDANLASSVGLSPELFYAIGYRAGRVTRSSALSLSAADRTAAVDDAIANNRVSSAFAATAAAQLSTLAGTVTSATLTDGTTSLPTRLDMILRIGGLTNSSDRAALLNAYLAFTGTPEDFWTNAHTLTGISSSLLTDVRSALLLGIYTLNHPPMVQSLWNSGIRDAKALGGLTSSDWATRIAATVTLPGGSPITVGFPNEIVGANSTAQSANYAASLATVNTRAFPSNAFRAAYTANPISSTTAISTFLSAHTDFDFAQESLLAYVRENSGVFPDAPSKAQVERFARLFKVSPETTRYATAKVLWDAGFDSARSIYLAGREPFIAKVTASPYSLSADTAAQVYDKSAHVTGVTSSIAMTYGQSFQAPGDGGALVVQGASSEIPDWDELFGSLDYCACDECASVHGPAAYLTDLLHFLEQRKSTNPSVTALGVLTSRRPDLTKIELSCTNTNTAVPYIDLLNEQLELRVNPATYDYQTTWSAPELAIHPEHLRAQAYDDLVAKYYPWNLPYSLWADEARTYIGLKDVNRSDLRGAFLVDPLTDAGWARETLGLTELQKEVIQGSGSLIGSIQPYHYWGMSSGSPWFASLSEVPAMLKRSGLSFDELSTLLGTKFVSSAQSPAVGIDLHNGCSIADADLTNVSSTSDPFFARVHRFERLRRSQGWTMRQTDRAIQNLGEGKLDAALLPELAVAETLVSRTSGKLDEVLTWRSGALIDTAADPSTGVSPFERMFPRRSAATGDEVFALAEDRTRLLVELGTPPALAGYSAALAKGLGTDVASLDFLVDELGLASAPLTLANISSLFRYVTLGRAVKLGVQDLIDLIELGGAMPFDVSIHRLPLTGWWRASYSGAPWAGTPSGGTSGSHPAYVGTVAPSVGTAVNGLSPAHFNGSSNYLRDNVNPFATYISGTGYRCALLVNVGANAAPAANAYQDAALVCDGGTGAWGIGVNSDEVRVYHAHTGVYTTLAQPITQGWHVIDVAYDGTTLSLSVDGNDAVTATVAALNGFGTDAFLIGANYDASAYFAGDIAEILVCDQPLTGISASAIKSYLEARYALDLAWSPKRNLAGTTFFLRADQAVTLSSGVVSAWADQSGLGDANRDAVQATAAKRPGYQASNPYFAGKPTVDCTNDGSQERQLKTGAWSSPTIGSDVTVAVVCRRAGTSTSNRYLYDSLSGNQFAVYQDNTGSAHYAYNAAAGNFASRNGDLTSPTALIVSAKNGQASKLRVNSNTANQTTSGDAGAFTPTGLTIGGYQGSGAYSDFEIAEFCVWLRQLSSNEIRALNSYFASRYGLVIAS